MNQKELEAERRQAEKIADNKHIYAAMRKKLKEKLKTFEIKKNLLMFPLLSRNKSENC